MLWCASCLCARMCVRVFGCARVCVFMCVCVACVCDCVFACVHHIACRNSLGLHVYKRFLGDLIVRVGGRAFCSDLAQDEAFEPSSG